MIYSETKLVVNDNSGAKKCLCIKVLNGSRRKGAKPCNKVVVSLKKVKSGKRLMKGDICRGILIRGKKNIQRNSGISLKFNDNAIILINEKGAPIGNRIYGPVYKEIYDQSFSKVSNVTWLDAILDKLFISFKISILIQIGLN